MADRLVSELTENTTLDATDELYLEVGLNGRKMSVANFGLTLPVTPTGATTARTLADRFAEVFNVLDFGAKGDGVTDDAAAIQAAIDACEAAGGGTVWCPAGTYLITATLLIDDNGVRLVGDGGSSLGGATQTQVIDNASTVIRWDSGTAGSVCIKFATPAGASEIGRKGGGIKDLLVDGDLTATDGIETITWDGALFENVAVVDMANGGFGWSLGTLGAAIADNTSSQHNTFINCGYQCIEAANTSIGMAQWSGEGTIGNFSLNYFTNLWFSMADGNSMELENCDSNTFMGIRSSSFAGTGGNIVLHADDTGASGKGGGATTCRGNSFWHVNMSAGEDLTAKATVAGSNSSNGNAIYHWSMENNGGAMPVIEDGADLLIFMSAESNVTDGAAIFGRGRRGVQVALSANESVAHATNALVPWDTEVYDTDGMWTSGAPNAFTVPNGIKMIRITVNLHWASNSTGYRSVTLTKNSVTVPGIPWDIRDASATTGVRQNISTTIQVSPGENIRVVVHQTSTVALDLVADDSTWVIVELL